MNVSGSGEAVINGTPPVTLMVFANETLETSQPPPEPEKDASVTEFVFEVILLSVISFFGLLGNIGAILLFATMKRQLKFHRLMMMLSAFDLIYVALSFMLFAMPRVSDYQSTKYQATFYYVQIQSKKPSGVCTERIFESRQCMYNEIFL